MSERDPTTILLTGTFDVANYGDLLFPLIAAARAREHDITVQAVSPTTGEGLPYRDAVRPIDVNAMLSREDLRVDAILVGGGYIIIGQQAVGLQTYEAAAVSSHAYPSLWMGATLAAALRDVPVIWNAPGVPYPFAQQRKSQLIDPALRAADYVSVRDAASAGLIRGPRMDVHVVPDTALDLPRVWSSEVLQATHAALVARKGFTADTRFFVVHCRGRALDDAQALANRIHAFAQTHDMVPLLISLAPCMGDDAVTRALSHRLQTPHLLLDDAQTLQELAAAIAGAQVYIGGSLHGYITAAAYGVPAVLMAKPAHGKFNGLLQHLDRPNDLAREWDSAFERASWHMSTDPCQPLPDSIACALDDHWAAMLASVAKPAARRDAREAFLREYIRHGASNLGASWAVGVQLAGHRSSEAPLSGGA